MKSTGMMKARLNGKIDYRSGRYLCLAFLLLVALAAFFVSPLWAANEGSNIPISIENGATSPDTATLLGDDQQNPTIIALPDKNKWFVVWEDWRNWSTSGSDIYGRFINHDGTYCGDEVAISTASGNQTVPTVAYRNTPGSSADNLLIAWQDTRGAAASGFLYYKILDISSLATDCSSGATLGGESALGYSQIGTDNLISRKLPKVAYDTARDLFWLVWVESRNALQRIEERPFGVAPGTTYWNFGDSSYVGYATITATTGASTTVEIIRNVGTYDRSVRLISHGTSASEDVYTYEYFKNVNNVTVSCDESSPETLIVWEGIRGRATLTCTYEDSPDPDDGPDYPDSTDKFFAEMVLDNWENDKGLVHIFSLFDKYITQSVVHSQLIDASTKSSFYPAVGFDTAHRKFLVAWEDRDPHGGVGDGIHSKIYGQLIYSGGGLYGNNLPISFQDTNGDGNQDQTVFSSNQTRPQISIDSTNQRFFVTWQDGRNSQVSLENLDIYGQFVDSEGSLRGNNYAVCVEVANQYNPVTVYNSGNHQFMTVWKDARNLNTTNSDIYGQRFTLGQPQLILLGEDGEQLNPPFINFPALEVGQNSSVTITMKNVGDSVIAIDSVTTLQHDPPFSYVNLPSELQALDGSTIDLIPGASYPLTVKFEPVATGVFIDDFTIESDSTKLKVNLQGRALEEPPLTDADIVPDPSSYNFGDVNLEETNFFVLTLTNTGNTAAKVNSYEISNGFSVIGLDGVVLEPGQKVYPIVKFNPKQARPYNGSLFVAYGGVHAWDSGGGAFQISLEGVGIGNIIAAVTPPENTNFGNVAVGDKKSANLTFTNTGNVDIIITAVDLLGAGFSDIEGIPATIPANDTLIVVATFSPTLPMAYLGTLRVLYDHGLPTSETVLSGVGVYNVNNVIEVPGDVDFGSCDTGDSKSANLRFFNKGSVDVTVTAVDLPDGVFSVSGIPGTIPAYGVLDVLVGFSPLLARDYNTTMRVLYDHGVVTSDIDLTGAGVDISQPAVTVEPQSIDFGMIALGMTKTETLVITNTGNVDFEIVGIDLPGTLFTVKGLSTGLLAEGMSTVATVTFVPKAIGDFSAVMRLLFDHDLPPQEILLQGTGMEVYVTPETLEFPDSEVDDSTVLTVTIINSSDKDLQIKGVATGTDNYSVGEIVAGDIIRSSGGALTCQVTFKPLLSGFFEDSLYINIGLVQDMANTPYAEIDWGTQYVVLLRGTANADFVVYDVDSYTADSAYKLSIGASTNLGGQVFVLLSHDPLSSGEIYALTKSGTLQPFPYEASFGWQNLWNLNSANPGLKIDLSLVDFRPLGCSSCQGENIDDGDNDFNFGNIIITPPDNTAFNNATDFKYMVGTLYMATYRKNASASGVFDFNQGLLEMQSFNIHSLSGTWQVTSRYYGVDRVHPTFLVVTEPGDGQISAVWAPYYPTMSYAEGESGYVMTFNMGIYEYTYKITALTDDSFTGSYTCIANGEIVAENELVSGIRLK